MATSSQTPFTPAPILVPNGSGSTSGKDASILPYMRKNEIEFVGQNLNPYKPAHVFFEDILVDRFVQVPSLLVLDGVNGNTTSRFSQGDGVYCNTTHAFATVIAGSGTQDLYINENYISINIAPVGTNTISSSYFTVGDLVAQYNISPTGVVGEMTFSGQVVFYSVSDSVVVVTPLFGSLVANSSADISINANPVLYNQDSSKNYIAYASNAVSGAKFIDSTVIFNIDKGFPARTASSSSYKSYSGVANVTANNFYANSFNSSKIVFSSNVPSTVVGNTLYFTSGTGYGQINQVISIATDNVTVTCQNAFTTFPDSTTLYSTTQLTVDDYGVAAGIFQLPEADNAKFLSGYSVMTISDSMIINDPASLMRATAFYYAGLNIPTASGAIPTVTPLAVIGKDGALINPGNPSSSQYGSNPTNLIDTSSAGLAPGLYDSTVTFPGSPQVHPLAQTFTTPPPKDPKTNYGIFVSSVDLWFSSKPVSPSPQLPVVVKLCTVDNGVPTTSNVLATSVVQCSQIATINIAANQLPDTVNIGPLAANNTTSTKFTFPDPVYLNPATDYAIVVYAESPYYDILTTEIGQTDLSSGSSTRKVSKQPNVGNFFTSQNSSQWTPIQNINMMFSLNKAQFDLDPVTWTFNITPYNNSPAVYYDKLLVTSSATTYPSTLLEYKVQPTIYDYSTSSFIQDPTLIQVNPNYYYNFGDNLNISAINGKTRWLLAGNSNSLLLQVDMQTLDPDVNPLFNSEMLGGIAVTNVINDGGIGNNSISIINPGLHFGYSNVSVNIYPNRTSSSSLSDPTVQLSGGVTAQANVIKNMINANTGALTQLNVWEMGSGYVGTPSVVINEPNTTVSLVSANVISGNLVVNVTSSGMQTSLYNKSFLFPIGGNVTLSAYSSANVYQITDYNTTILTAASSSGINATFNIAAQLYMANTAGGTVTFAPSNATASVAGEDKASGGNALCRYQTKQVVLADGFDSGDLRVWVDGIIPVGTSVQVYYKVMSKSDPDQFNNKYWQLMAPINPVNSPDQQTPVEIQYADYPLIGGNPSGRLSYVQNGIQYPLGGTFKYFAIKLVLLAEDTAVPPVITGLRATAVPAG